VVDNENGDSFNYPGHRVQKIKEVTFADDENRALYQPWATDLLPFEVRANTPVSFDSQIQHINYVGTIGHDNIKHKFKVVLSEAKKDKKYFNLFSGLDSFSAQQVIQKSYISFDVRGDWHIQRGYIPCRIWKSLSYGKYIGSNSPLLKSIFGDRVNFNANESDLYWTTKDNYSRISAAKQQDSINWIAENHTFANRANSVLEYLTNF
jgi:hypothetical protein